MIKAKLDTSDLERKLKQLSKDLDKTAEQTVIDIAKTGGQQLAYRIEPYGLGSTSEEISKKAIYKDVNKAYDDIGQTFNTLKKININIAYAYANAVRRGDLDAAEKIVRPHITGYKINTSDNGNHLDTVRGNNGRVPDGARVMGLNNEVDLDNIKKEKVVTAGTAKAGWLQAAMSIGSKSRIPKWLKKNQYLGTSKVVKNGWKTTVTLINRVRYADKLLSDSKINAAIQNAYRNNVKRMEKALEAITKKF